MIKIIFILFFSISLGIEKPKIALVLSGGGAKGISEIPAMHIIDSLNIPIDYIIGTSMGAIGGAYYSIGYSPHEIKNISDETDWDLIFSNQKRRSDLNYFQKYDYDKYQAIFSIDGIKPKPPIAISSGHSSYSYLNKLTRYNDTIYDFDNFVIPFRCNAVDLLTGKEVIFKNGSLAKSLRCSSSIPSVFNPINDGEKLLIDGGVLNNLATDIAKELGADIIIAVDCDSFIKQKNDIIDVFDVLSQSIQLGNVKKKNENLLLADVLIQPNLTNYSLLDFNEKSLQGIYLAGYQATYEKLDELIEIKNKTTNINKIKKLSSLNTDSILINSIKLVTQSNLNINDIFSFELPIKINKNEIVSFFRNLRLTNKYNNIHYYFTDLNDGYKLHICLEKNNPLKINNIFLTGNKKIDNDFILNIIEISKGDTLDYNHLDSKIEELYNIDFFESIRYELINIDNNSTDIKFIFVESDFKRLKLGVSWNNYYRLTAQVKLDLIYKPFDKFRIQNNLRFGDQLQENNFKILYTGNYNFQFPIIPFMKINNIKKKINYYSELQNFESQNIGINEQTFGILIPIRSLGYFEFETVNQSTNYTITPEEDKDFKYNSINFEIDKIDNILYPRDGYKIDFYYEKSSKENYKLQRFSFDKYFKILERSSVKIYGDYFYADSEIPLSKNINYFNPDRFLSFGEYQIFGNNITSYGIEINYLYKKSQTLRLILNTMHNIDFPNNIDTNNQLSNLGLGLRVKSIFGPINFLWTKSNKDLFNNNNVENYYFSIGIDY